MKPPRMVIINPQLHHQVDWLELEQKELKLLVAKKQKQNSFKWLDREIVLKKKRFQKTMIQQRSVIHIWEGHP